MEYDPACPTDTSTGSVSKLVDIPLPVEILDMGSIPLPPSLPLSTADIVPPPPPPPPPPLPEPAEILQQLNTGNTHVSTKFSLKLGLGKSSNHDSLTEKSAVFDNDNKEDETKAMPKLQAMMKRSKPATLPTGMIPNRGNKLPEVEHKTELFKPPPEALPDPSQPTHDAVEQPQPAYLPTDTAILTSLQEPEKPDLTVLNLSQADSEAFTNAVREVNALTSMANLASSGIDIASSAIDSSLPKADNALLPTPPIPKIPTNHFGVPLTTPTLIPSLMTLPVLPVNPTGQVPGVRTKIPPATLQYLNPQKLRSAQMIAQPLIANPIMATQAKLVPDDSAKDKEISSRRRSRSPISRRHRSSSRRHTRSRSRSRSRRRSRTRSRSRRRSRSSSRRKTGHRRRRSYSSSSSSSRSRHRRQRTPTSPKRRHRSRDCHRDSERDRHRDRDKDKNRRDHCRAESRDRNRDSDKTKSHHRREKDKEKEKDRKTQRNSRHEDNGNIINKHEKNERCHNVKQKSKTDEYVKNKQDSTKSRECGNDKHDIGIVEGQIVNKEKDKRHSTDVSKSTKRDLCRKSISYDPDSNTVNDDGNKNDNFDQKEAKYKMRGQIVECSSEVCNNDLTYIDNMNGTEEVDMSLQPAETAHENNGNLNRPSKLVETYQIFDTVNREDMSSSEDDVPFSACSSGTKRISSPLTILPTCQQSLDSSFSLSPSKTGNECDDEDLERLAKDNVGLDVPKSSSRSTRSISSRHSSTADVEKNVDSFSNCRSTRSRIKLDNDDNCLRREDVLNNIQASGTLADLVKEKQLRDRLRDKEKKAKERQPTEKKTKIEKSNICVEGVEKKEKRKHRHEDNFTERNSKSRERINSSSARKRSDRRNTSNLNEDGATDKEIVDDVNLSHSEGTLDHDAEASKLTESELLVTGPKRVAAAAKAS